MKPIFLIAALTMGCIAAPAVEPTNAQSVLQVSDTALDVAPVAITDTSVVLPLPGAVVYIDPAGPQSPFRAYGRPDVVVLTSAETSHLSIETMIGLLRRDTVVLAPQSVIDRLPLMISNNVITPFEIGSTQDAMGLTFRALPLADGAPSVSVPIPRDQGDYGVVVEIEGAQLYF